MKLPLAVMCGIGLGFVLGLYVGGRPTQQSGPTKTASLSHTTEQLPTEQPSSSTLAVLQTSATAKADASKVIVPKELLRYFGGLLIKNQDGGAYQLTPLSWMLLGLKPNEDIDLLKEAQRAVDEALNEIRDAETSVSEFIQSADAEYFKIKRFERRGHQIREKLRNALSTIAGDGERADAMIELLWNESAFAAFGEYDQEVSLVPHIGPLPSSGQRYSIQRKFLSHDSTSPPGITQVSPEFGNYERLMGRLMRKHGIQSPAFGQ